MDKSDESKFAEENMENLHTVKVDDNKECLVDNSIVKNLTGCENIDDIKSTSNKLENAMLVDDPNEEEITKIKEKKHGNRKRILSLSDSDEDLENQSIVNNKEDAIENEFKQSELNGVNEEEHKEQKVDIRKSRKRITILDSDSEDEPSVTTENNAPSSIHTDSSNGNLTTKSDKNPELDKWNLNFDDSDSDLENLITTHNKSFSETTSVQPLSPDNEGIKCDQYNLSENSDDESNNKINNRHSEENNSGDEKDYSSDNEITKSIKYKRKKSKKNGEESLEMTAREAVKQREEIRSETQRLVRESNISLPYHRPKSYTLKEFLARRPKFASAVLLATKTPPSIAMKMATQQLEAITKKLEERHKEVQEFYKSDSENEDENDDEDYIPPGDETSEEDIKKADNNTDDITNNLDKNSDCKSFIEKYKAVEQEVVNNLNDIDNKCNFLMDIDNEETESITKNFKSNNSEQVITDEIALSSNISAEDTAKNNQFNDKIKVISAFIIKPSEHQPNLTDNDKTLSNNITESNLTLDTSDKSNNIINLSEDYEFNIDDIEDDTMEITNDKNNKNDNQDTADKLLDPEFLEIHNEIENLISEKPIVPEPTKSKLKIIKESFLNDRPRLSGSPNHLINLDTIIKPNEVTRLMERFVLHTAKKAHHKETVKLNVVGVEQGGEIYNETVSVSVDSEEIAIEEKPGVRLQRLRNELQSQIAQRKSEIWQQRAAAKDKDRSEIDLYDGEKSECGAEDNILDDEEEDEMSESSDEDEIEEDLTENEPTKKSEFMDDEAEESDVEDNEENIENDENEEDGGNEGDDDQVDEENEEQESNNDESNEEQIPNELPFKKPLRRIIKAFTEDSDDEENAILPGEIIGKISEKLNKSIESDSNCTQDEYITPYQQQTLNKTPNKSECNNSDSIFLTPVSYITSLQNLSNSASKANVPSPLKESDWRTEFQKKLHTDSIITNSQAEAMKELCSEDFSVSQDLSNENGELSPNLTDLTGDVQVAPPNTQEILNICSGTFEESQTDGISSLPILNSNGSMVALNAVEEVKSLDKDQDMIISQLLNEEELETFKKKFESPIVEHFHQSNEEAIGGGGIIESDDDEEGMLEVRKKKIHQKKLTFSDDESSVNDDEERDLSDEEIDDAEPLPAEINYDSEENEVDYMEEREKKPLKAKDFFEDEAELSESEWGSDDEDEKDLDVLEFEQGDKDQFDNKKLRMDLEKIHMRRILDDDTREVKLLQELLLDDGELHGTGRERQFRWKNADSNFPAEDETRGSDDEAPVEEDDSEEQWRRRRHEREMFLKENKSQQEDSEIFHGSEILKLGYKVIKSSSNNSQSSNNNDNKTDASSSPAIKKAFGLLHKRGSFLNRGETMLKKLAEFNKITSEVSDGPVKAGKKTSKNFLFQTVAQQESPKSVLNLKRKSDSGTPKIIKKLRLTDNLSPADKRKQNTDRKIKAKLFQVS